MTVFVLLRFDWLTLNASSFSPNVTLLLHNPPAVEVPDSVVPFYTRRGQIIEIRVRLLRIFIEIYRFFKYAAFSVGSRSMVYFFFF